MTLMEEELKIDVTYWAKRHHNCGGMNCIKYTSTEKATLLNLWQGRKVNLGYTICLKIKYFIYPLNDSELILILLFSLEHRAVEKYFHGLTWPTNSLNSFHILFRLWNLSSILTANILNFGIVSEYASIIILPSTSGYSPRHRNTIP